jgi:hypothetical protein
VSSIDQFRAGLDATTLQIVDRLRQIIRAAHRDLSERIKWNAPSFALGDTDLITLGLERRGGVRVVLHRGAKPKDVAGFEFSDPAGLATWPAPDRGVIVFHGVEDVEARREGLEDLFARWLRQPPR